MPTPASCIARRPPQARAWLFALLCALGLTRAAVAAEPAPTAPTLTLAVPEHGAYTGAYIDFGDTEDQVTLEGLERFEALVGKHQAIVAFSNFWGEGGLPLRSLRILDAYGAIPLLFWSPWEAPYNNRSAGRFRLDHILAGDNDAFIDDWAAQAAAWGKPMLVAWGIEMNGTWFPWSGVFYGGGAIIEGSDPPRYQGPETYKRAFRYVVDRVRAKGARNVLWVYHSNHGSSPDEPWNQIDAYWPGSDYVDWVGVSAYGKQFPFQHWYSFKGAFLNSYNTTIAMAPNKPFILAEWGVGEFADGDKGAYIEEAFRRMEEQSPRLKAAVFWHERWQNGDLSYSNLRVHSSLGALNAYRKGVARPFWLERPILVPAAGPTEAPK